MLVTHHDSVTVRLRGNQISWYWLFVSNERDLSIVLIVRMHHISTLLSYNNSIIHWCLNERVNFIKMFSTDIIPFFLSLGSLLHPVSLWVSFFPVDGKKIEFLFLLLFQKQKKNTEEIYFHRFLVIRMAVLLMWSNTDHKRRFFTFVKTRKALDQCLITNNSSYTGVVPRVCVAILAEAVERLFQWKNFVFWSGEISLCRCIDSDFIQNISFYGPFTFGNCTKDLSPWEEAVTRMSVKLQLQRAHQANLKCLSGESITTFHLAIIFYHSLLRYKLARLCQRANWWILVPLTNQFWCWKKLKEP